MKKGIITVVILALYFKCNAQIKFYKTYENYKNNIYEEFTKFKYNLLIEGMYVNLKLLDKNNETVIIQNKDYWGFTYKDNIFRFLTSTDSNNVNRFYVCLVSKGKVMYYENGLMHLNALVTNSKKGFYDFSDGRCFFSKDLNSTISEDIFGKFLNNPSHQQFFTKYREYDQLYSCLLSDNKELENIKYNGDFGKIKVTKNGSDVTPSKISVYIRKLDIETVRKCVLEFNKE